MYTAMAVRKTDPSSKSGPKSVTVIRHIYFWTRKEISDNILPPLSPLAIIDVSTDFPVQGKVL